MRNNIVTFSLHKFSWSIIFEQVNLYEITFVDLYKKLHLHNVLQLTWTSLKSIVQFLDLPLISINLFGQFNSFDRNTIFYIIDTQNVIVFVHNFNGSCILVYKRYIWVTYFIFYYQKSVVSLLNPTQYLGEHCRSCHNILESNANV